MGSDKKSRDKKKQEVKDQYRKPQETVHQGNGDHVKTKLQHKQKNSRGNKTDKGGRAAVRAGWSSLAKLNMLLLLVVAALAARVVYVHSDGDVSTPGVERAHGRLAVSWLALRQLSQRQTATCWQWLAGHAHRLDSQLMASEVAAPYWLPVKTAAGRAAAAGTAYGAVAADKALYLAGRAYAAGWKAGRTGWTAAQPYINATLTAAQPHWEAATRAAAPVWDAAAEHGTAVKAGAVAAAARMRRDVVPALMRWSEAAQRAAADAWDTVQRDAPVHAEKAWLASCRAAAAAWDAACAGWKVVCTEAALYRAAAADRLDRFVASLTGGDGK